MKKFAIMLLAIIIVVLIGYSANRENKNPISEKDIPVEKFEESQLVSEADFEYADTEEMEQEDEEEITDKIKGQQLVILDKSWKGYSQLSEGLCAVLDKDTGMWGYVDKTGEYVIEPQFYEALPFSEDLAAVQGVSGFYNFIDKSGNLAISGDFSGVRERFRGSYRGFSDGYAVVEKSDKYLIIDKAGTTIKELQDYPMHYNKKGELVYYSGGFSNQLSDTLYNEVETSISGLLWLYSEGQGGCRSSFNHSTKYMIFDNRDTDDEGTGLYVIGSDGSIAFEQKQIPEINNTHDYEMGITDDYVVITRNINGIRTSAVYDYSGAVIMDYKYKKIVPVSKELFCVTNNADVCALIDLNEKEILPFSAELQRDPESVVSELEEKGIITFGTENAPQYFDLKSGEIKDGLTLSVYVENLYGSADVPISAYDYVYFTEAGPMFCFDGNFRDSVFNEFGQKINDFEHFFSGLGLLGDSNVRIHDQDAFFNSGIIPIRSEDGSGYTFAIYQ